MGYKPDSSEHREHVCDSTSIYASIYISNKCFAKGLARECGLAS